jgi:hypothetical protein
MYSGSLSFSKEQSAPTLFGKTRENQRKTP